ncbi:hypothetical protein L1987_85262 [Smallanthus sonchifolius]|uniref:Uncharacterized protein n=1 Tax=Smallanthus sonchifolius TaxID=185202 RepID=A0ACB8XX80_9ASTR|nr:hypothetical protein L1987_85262 [Smallanthus sonchifolius]
MKAMVAALENPDRNWYTTATIINKASTEDLGSNNGKSFVRSNQKTNTHGSGCGDGDGDGDGEEKTTVVKKQGNLMTKREE